MDLEMRLDYQRMIKALDKMHNGLPALIDEHQKLAKRVKEREERVNNDARGEGEGAR